MLANPVVMSPENTVTDSEDAVLRLQVMGKSRSTRWCRDFNAMRHLLANVIYAECTKEVLVPLQDTAMQFAKRLNIPIILYGPAAMLIAYSVVDKGGSLEEWPMSVMVDEGSM